ncbi:MAG: peptidoglycan -binding protein [Pseudomonadota bacterium]
MALSRRSGQRFTASIWPGFVDALTALLLILMFVLSIFMIIQFSLREMITGQDKELENLNNEVVAKTEEIAAKGSEIDALNSQLAGLADALGLERDRTSNLEAEVGSLRSTLTDERAEIDRLTAALGAMTQQFETERAQSSSLLADLEAERAGRAADIERLGGELEVSQQQALALQTALTAARGEIDQQAEEARLAAARREALDALVARLESDRDARDADIRVLEADKARALALIETLNADKTAAEERIADLDTRTRELDSEKAAALAIIARLEEQNAGIVADVERLDTEKAAALALIAQLEATRDDNADTISRLEQETAERQALIDQLGTDKAAALALVETFKASLEADQQALADLEQQQAQTEEERARLEAQLAERQTALERLQAENAERLKAFENLSSEQALALATIAKLEAERETEAERLARLQAERDRLTEAEASAAAQADQFQFDLKAALDRAADLASRLTAAEEAKLADAAAAQALRERLAESQTELDAVTLALEEARKDAEETLTLLAAAEASRSQLSESALAAADRIDRETALRAVAEQQLSDAQQQTLDEQRKVAALTAQVKELNTQLGTLQALLDDAAERDREAKVQIAELGSQLNQALAQKVSELSRFRSEFFGRMRDVLGGREGIQVVGDRFVFQSEILFSSASAILGPEGQIELSKLAEVVRELASTAPEDLNWVLRVDGHTDPVPLSGTGRYRDNWELSQARALSVVRYMIDIEGIPPNRLAATGFGEYQPIVEGFTAEDNARNRRIEFKFTER